MSGQDHGILSLKIGGVIYHAKGNFELMYGNPTREPVVGSDGIHGHKVTPTPAGITGEITDRGDLRVRNLFDVDGDTITVERRNGKVFVLSNAVWGGDSASVNTEEGNIPVTFYGDFADEI